LRLVVRSEAALHLLREHWPSLQASCPSIHVFSVNLQPEPKAVLEGDTEIVISHARALSFELGAIADGGQGSSSAVRGSPNQGSSSAVRGSPNQGSSSAVRGSPNQGSSSAVRGSPNQGSSSAVRGSPTSLQLLLPTQAFFQTHTSIAKQLYQAASRWIQPWCEDFFKQRGAQPRIHDLYCGVGGFALHIAAHTHASVAGFELSQTAIEAAQTAAHHNGVRAHFYQADATRLPERAFAADAFLVNPPRRGLGALLCDAIAQSKAIRLWYSSCNLSTLAADLQRIGTRRPFRLRRVQLFDMFPHTEHFEVLCEVELE
jgi:23S rRNA (uracil747-C5)-methyltransferase